MRAFGKIINIAKYKKRTAINVILIMVFFYFMFHAVAGNRGLLAYFQLSKAITDMTPIVDELKLERLELEHKVNLLKSAVDLDMLDQEARKALGLASEKEKIFTVTKPHNNNEKKDDDTPISK